MSKAEIISKTAEAEASAMIGEATKKFGSGLVAIKKIETARIMVEELHRNPNISFIQGQNTMNMLNLNKGL